MAEENNEQVIEDDPIEVRRAKREALLAEGKNPYGHAAFEYSHHIADLDEKYAELADGETPKSRFHCGPYYGQARSWAKSSSSNSRMLLVAFSSSAASTLWVKMPLPR